MTAVNDKSSPLIGPPGDVADCVCCTLGTGSCGSISEESGRGCTRKAEHDGDHVACGIVVHQIESWERVSES